MSISESGVRMWVGKACAVVDGATLDYLSVSIPSTRAARSFIEHAKVVVGDKSATSVATEVWGHVEDILQSAANEGKSEVVIKILLYRMQAPAGSTTFRSDIAPNGGSNDDDDSGSNSTNMANALVSTVKEMRLANKDLLNVVQAATGEGWKLAGDMLKANQALQKDNTELQIALVASSQSEKDDPMKQLATKAAGDFMDVMKMKAMLNAQEEATEKARLADERAKQTTKE